MRTIESGHSAEGLGKIHSKAILLDEGESGSQTKQLSVV
jgi:hypothetical protein